MYPASQKKRENVLDFCQMLTDFQNYFTVGLFRRGSYVFICIRLLAGLR